MGKCNLLAPVAQSTGNFILFSQYAEDLTRSSQSEDYYRVTPSKYVLLNLDQTGMDPVQFSEFFQNYYENSCSILRSNSSVDWTPDCATAMFWKALFKSGLAIMPYWDETDASYHSPSVLKVGDINITSTKQYDGIYYSEIYVNVPQGSKRCKYAFQNFSAEQTRMVQWPHDYIAGYPDGEYPTPVDQPWPSNRLTDQYCDSTVSVEGHTEYLYTLRSTTDFVLDTEPIRELDDASYTFDAVVVLYDVHKKNLEVPEDTTIYRDVPMGLYLTGAPKELGGIQNPVTIWVQNSDIYEQGTSYGFRICTRYLATQNSLYIVDSTIAESQELYDQYAAVMGKIGDSQVKMDQIASQMVGYQNNITSHLANIKNYKVNVPYIRNIGGVDYWFVNGNNLGVATVHTDLFWENY